MKTIHPLLIACIAGGLSAFAAFFLNAGADNVKQPALSDGTTLEYAIFAGGCFWCVESDFDKVASVRETVSGYIGGKSENPTYKTHGQDGHYEAVRVSYDPALISYDQLVAYFFRHIDPLDAGGQFCDRGDSYRTAVFVKDEAERQSVEREIEAINASGTLPSPIVTKVIEATKFTPAELYHQDYYIKNQKRYKYYRWRCGRDARIEELWGEKPPS